MKKTGNIKEEVCQDLLKGVRQGVSHLNNASIKVEKESIILYIDPFKIEGNPHDADIIFCKLKKLKPAKIIVVEPDNDYEVKGIKFKTVPSYNINRDVSGKTSVTYR